MNLDVIELKPECVLYENIAVCNSSFLCSTNDDLVFLSLNIRSLRQNFDEFLCFMETMNTKPYVVVLSEIWITDEETSLYQLDGYSSFFACNNEYRSGGIVIFVSNVLTPLSHCKPKVRGADMCMVDVKLGPRQFKVIGIYRLHSVHKSVFIEDLDLFLGTILTDDLIVLGDFNINMHDDQFQNLCFSNTMAAYGLVPLIEIDTRVTHYSSTCIDQIFVRLKLVTTFLSCLVDSSITDHRVVIAKWKVNAKNFTSSEKRIKVTQYKQVSVALENFNWELIKKSNNPNFICNYIIQTLQSILNEATYTVTGNSRKLRPRSPWINGNLISLINFKNKLFLKMRRRPFDTSLKNRYKKFAAKVKVEVKKCKESYFNAKFKYTQGDIRKQWKAINELIGHKQEYNLNVIESDGVMISDPLVIANTFNNYFIESVSNLIDKLPKAHCASANTDLLPTLSGSSQIFEKFDMVSEEDIALIVKSLNNSRSKSFDSIPVRVIKENVSTLAPILGHLINSIFETGVFPNDLKRSVVIPIFKNGSKTCITNYRPISILPTLAKIVEKIMKQQIVEYLENMQFFFPSQFGFRSGLGTEDALEKLSSNIYTSLNTPGAIPGALFVDFSKAFDTVNHDILRSKLRAAGFSGTALDLLRSYLSERKQQVRISDALGDVLSVPNGVPQGSVLGPLLFLIYINDLCTNINLKGNAIVYADDFALTYSCSSLSLFREELEWDLGVLKCWLTDNQMSINVKKTKYMIFSPRNRKMLDQPVMYCGSDRHSSIVVDQVESFRYLGVTLDEHFSWRSHVTQLYKSLSPILRALYFIRKLCIPSVLWTVYHSLFLSKINYGIAFWGKANNCIIKCILKSHKASIKIITGRPKTYPTKQLFLESGLLDFENLYKYKVLKLFFKRSRGGGLYSDGLMYSTRFRVANRVNIPKINLSLFKQSFEYNAIVISNSLPRELRKNMQANFKQKSLFSYLRHLQ